MELAIVDCGSGYSRLTYFGIDPDDGLVHTQRVQENLPALHKVIISKDLSKEWISKLHALVNDFKGPVIVGATAGIRDALIQGKITQNDLDHFQRRLSPPLSLYTFLLLSGEDEALYDFSSAKYCALHTNIIEPNTPVGLLSSGGQSSQIAFSTNVYSYNTATKFGNQLGIDHGMSKSVEMFRGIVETTLEDMPKNLGSEGAVFIGIEMLAAAASAAGIPSCTFIPVSSAIKSINSFLSDSTSNETPGSKTWKDYVQQMSSIILLKMLSNIHPGSKVLFEREFEMKGKRLKPSWGLGLAVGKFIERKINESGGSSSTVDSKKKDFRIRLNSSVVIISVITLSLFYVRSQIKK